MAVEHIPRIICLPGSENEFGTADTTYVIDSYVAGDWDGSSGFLTYWYSDTSGVPAYISAPSDATVHYSYWRDIHNLGVTINASSNTNIDGGGNTGITFGSYISYFDATSAMDNSSVHSYVNMNALIENIQAIYAGDPYFDSTEKIGHIRVFYTHENGRQRKVLYYPYPNHIATVSWGPYSKDGTWNKTGIKTYDRDGADVFLGIGQLPSNENIYHDSTLGITYFNTL